MEWRDEGTLLAVRRHGESAAIIEVFTLEHGRHAGVVRGGGSRRLAPILMPGAQLDVTWRARLEDHIGTFTVEPSRSRAGLMSERLALAALNSVCAILHTALPEREPHTGLYLHTMALLDRLGDGEQWVADYLGWERSLLEDLGYGLDLTSCAVTGSSEDLAYVSPKTGRAVSRLGAGEWADRLLPLPAALIGTDHPSREDIVAGLRTTGHFIEHWLFAGLGHRDVPPARHRLVTLLARQG